MSSYTFADVESAVLTALAPLTVEQGGTVETLKGYAGEAADPRSLTALAKRLPAVLVAVTGADYTPLPCNRYQRTCTVNILVADRDWRSGSEARTGVYGLLAEMSGILCGNDLGLSISPMTLVSEREVGSTEYMVMFMATYQAEELEWQP